jgi:hypothetical protein
VKSNESGTTSNQRSSESNYTHPPYTFQQQTNKQDSQMSTDLYVEIIKSTQMTNTFDRDSLIEEYAQQVVDGMDMDTLISFAFDTICERMDEMNDNEVVNEVNEYYPELLEQNNIDPDIYI